MNKKPNIIFIQNDHQAYYRWGWENGEKPKRPHFEKLAQEGATFSNAYCATPLCGPTRRTMLTGLYSHTHGQTHNYTDPDYNHEVYLDTLAENGYKNFYYGKWHAGPGAANDHQCEGFSTTDYGNPYITSTYKEYLEKHNLPSAVHHITKVFDIPEFADQGDFLKLKVGADYQCESFWCGEHAVGVTTTPKETHEAFFLANLACEKLEELAKQPGDEPFHLRVDFWGPHQPYFPTQEFLDMYKDLQLPEYGSFRSDLAGKPEFYHRERSIPFGKDNKLVIPNPVAWEEWNDIVRYCFAHITMIDAAGGMILDKLKALGLDENTIVIWTTDHGDALASHGGHFDKGSYLSEEVMRIPLAMKWKGQITPGQVRDEYVSTVDYPVTILDAAQTQFTKNEVHGRSILPLVTDQDVTWREEIMSETHGHGYGEEVVSRMIAHNGYKYIWTKNNLCELYHLAEDPFELKNLIDDTDYAEVLQDMKVRLAKWQEQTNDPERAL
ncbi:MAG: sulfatase-like hydrolase/transferase [Cellulosilyticaceae bacterium]